MIDIKQCGSHRLPHCDFKTGVFMSIATTLNYRAFALFCSAGLLLTACDNPPSPVPPKATVQQNVVVDKSVEKNEKKDGRVGQVGDQPFMEGDIDREFSQMPENFQKMKDNVQMRGNILNNIMTRYALTLQAKKEGIDKDPEVHAQLERMEQNILLQELNKKAKERLAPSDVDIKAYYDGNKEKFAVKEQVHVAHILVKDQALAQKIHQKLKKGADFADLAKQYSTDASTKDKGGELSPFSKGMMVPEFEQASFALNKEGGISSPVQTNYGFHVIKLIAHIPSHQQVLPEVKAQIENVLTQEHFRDWVNQVKQEMEVKVLDSSYMPPGPRGL